MTSLGGRTRSGGGRRAPRVSGSSQPNRHQNTNWSPRRLRPWSQLHPVFHQHHPRRQWGLQVLLKVLSPLLLLLSRYPPPISSSTTSPLPSTCESTSRPFFDQYSSCFHCSPHVSDRERIVRPFRVAGLIGAFNVFALVRGGGSTGQSGAICLGIAKALAAHVPDSEAILRKGLFFYTCWHACAEV